MRRLTPTVEMSYRIGVDVGGTFTDFVAQSGPRLIKGKVSSRPGNEATSVMEALSAIAEDQGLQLRTLLEAADSIVLGTTVVLIRCSNLTAPRQA